MEVKVCQRFTLVSDLTVEISIKNSSVAPDYLHVCINTASRTLKRKPAVVNDICTKDEQLHIDSGNMVTDLFQFELAATKFIQS